MDTYPLISIIIPIFNRTTWLSRAIESCLQQAYPNIEIIVVDDGSTTDAIRQIATRYPKIVYERQPNQGAGSARNLGLSRCSGEYIQFLDDDDWLSIDALAKKMDVISLITEKNQTVVYTDLWLTQIDETIICKYFEHRQRPLPEGNIFPSLLHNNFIPIHSLLFPKSILISSGGFPNRSGVEDWEMLVKTSLKANFIFLDEPLGYYRLHQNNISFDLKRQMEGELSVINFICQQNQFNNLPDNLKISCLINYFFRHWSYGTPKSAQELLSRADRIKSWHPKVFLAKFLKFLGPSITRIVFKIFLRVKFGKKTPSSQSYFLSK